MLRQSLSLRVYSPLPVESKWQSVWDHQLPLPYSPLKPYYYSLSQFPYPSGKLHMGHVRVYTISDTIARIHRMKQFNVLHPMGWDAFGLPAENAAIERGIQPEKWTIENIQVMKKQLKLLGFKFDWEKEISTCDPSYYKWTQWLFLRLFKKKLAYQKYSYVNWDPIDQTVLANEQVDQQGKSWRSGALVEKKLLKQWFLKITDFAEPLLASLENLSWPDKVKDMQRNWIGKSEGTYVDFQTESSGPIRVFTTRVETLFGCTFIALSKSHSIASQFKDFDFNKSLPIYAIHPITSSKLPVFVADYVLEDYGTGALMGVPAHDTRDRAFAKSKSLDIIQVLDDNNSLVNSGIYNGMSSADAMIAITQELVNKKVGHSGTLFRLRDWLVSRQRYWGAPIPIIHCDKCGPVAVPEKDLPVKLPTDVKFTGKGASPLLSAKDWLNTTCPCCGSAAKRETDTLDTFVDSSWYYLRYPNADNNNQIFIKEDSDKWNPVPLYVGGIEHAILHLLYSRFISHFLHSEGLIASMEPFQRLLTQGMVCGRGFKDDRGSYVSPDLVDDSGTVPILKSSGEKLSVVYEKMSKSKNNGVSPQDVISQFGADVCRLYVLFRAPPESQLDWDPKQILGQQRWLQRLWKLVEDFRDSNVDKTTSVSTDSTEEQQLKKNISTVIRGVNSAIDTNYQLHVALAALMKFSNELASCSEQLKLSPIYFRALQILFKLLAPMAPHITSEAWNVLNNKLSDKMEDVHDQVWPPEETLTVDDREVELPIVVDGLTVGSLRILASLINSSNKEGLDSALKLSEWYKNSSESLKVRSIHVKKGTVRVFLDKPKAL